MEKRIHLIVLLITASLLTACGAQATSTPNPGIVPNSLQTIEAAAEDIIDFAPSENWDRISKDVTDIETAWISYELQADKDGASPEIQDLMNSAIVELKKASESKDPSTTMQGSNDVSAAVVELFALYHPNIPADIGRLDVLERQIILDIAAQDYAAAEKSLAKTKSVWGNVKLMVLEHDGKDVAAEFEASLAAQESALGANDEKALTSEAKNGLEIVDDLERLY
jgi:hypothetical protein